MSEEVNTTVVEPTEPPEPTTPPIEITEPTEPPTGEPTESVEELKAQLEKLNVEKAAAEIAKKKAEQALDSTKRENSKLKRSSMSVEEQLAEERKELEAKARQYDIDRNKLTAKSTLTSAGFVGEDVDEIIELITSEDSDKTKDVADGLAEIIKSRVDAAVKAEKEKLLKEMPIPPGGSGEVQDPLLAGFDEG